MKNKLTVLLLLTLLTNRYFVYMTRREQEIEQLRKSIICQSWKIITEEGWQALSIRKIADAIQYSVPMIYKHFENKEAIIEYFSKEGFELLSVKLSEAQNSALSIEEQIEKIAYAYWQFSAEHTQHYRIMFGLGIPPCEAINSNKEMSTTSGIMLDAISKFIPDTTDANKYLKLKTFWSMLHGFIAIELLSNNRINQQPAVFVKDAIEGFIFTLKHKI